MITINILKDRIWQSKRITEKMRFDAIEDLEFMESSRLYAERVDYDKQLHYYNDVFDMFSLSKSILGYNYWCAILSSI